MLLLRSSRALLARPVVSRLSTSSFGASKQLSRYLRTAQNIAQLNGSGVSSTLLREFHMSHAALGLMPFKLANIWEGIAEVEVIEWFIKEGDTIRQSDNVCEVQSDKGTVKIISLYDGVVKTIHYKTGEMAAVGTALINIEVEGMEGMDVPVVASKAGGYDYGERRALRTVQQAEGANDRRGDGGKSLVQGKVVALVEDVVVPVGDDNSRVGALGGILSDVAVGSGAMTTEFGRDVVVENDIQDQIKLVEGAIIKVEDKIEGVEKELETAIGDNRAYLREEKKQLREKEKQLREKEKQLREEMAREQVAAPRLMSRMELAQATKDWIPRDVPSSEGPGQLEKHGWPLLHRKAQLAEVVQATRGALASDDATRRVLATHAPPGSGKTRFLRTLVLPVDQIAKCMTLDDGEAREVGEWAAGRVRVHVSFNGGSAFHEHETGDEYVWLARRLLHAYFDIQFEDVRSLSPKLMNVVAFVLERAGKRRMLLCVDELAATGSGKAIATACKVVQHDFFMAGMDVQALVSTLDSSIELVESTSQMELQWVHLDPVPVDDITSCVPSYSVTDTILLALWECGGHPRTVEYFLEAVNNNRCDPVLYATQRLCSRYMGNKLRGLVAGALANVMAHVVLKRELPWNLYSTDVSTTTLNQVSWMLLNSRGRSTDAVPFTSPIFLRAVVNSFHGDGTGDPEDQRVADLLHHMLLPDRDCINPLSFETFHSRWAALRMWALVRLNIPAVSVPQLYPNARLSADLKAVFLRPVVVPTSLRGGALQAGAHVQCGDVVCMPPSTPGMDVLCVWRGNNDLVVPFLELIQLKYYIRTGKLPIDDVREAAANARVVVRRMLEKNEVPMYAALASSKTLATDVHLPEGVVDGNDVVVVVGTFDDTQYRVLPVRTIVVSMEALKELYGPTFMGTAQMLCAVQR